MEIKNIFWDKTKIGGDKRRILNINKLKKLGFKNNYSFDEALKETIDWYKINRKKK